MKRIESPKTLNTNGPVFKFFNDFRALFIKAFFLAIRKPRRTIAEILLAYTFIGLILGLRYILDRRYYSALQIPAVRPQDLMIVNGTGTTVYYYPNNTCTYSIVNTAMNDIRAIYPTFTSNMEVVTDPTLSSMNSTTLSSIFAYIYFTNMDPCTSSSSVPDQVAYTLRLPENGPYYYRPQLLKISENDYLWKRAPEDFCQGNSSLFNYTYRFIGVQYSVDAAIIKYATGAVTNLSSNLYLGHFGCPEFHQDQFHTIYGFFIPIFISVIYLITFIMTVGYIVEERQNKTKEYLRIYGLRTWINNLVWVIRALIILFILTGVLTGFSMLVMPSLGGRYSVTKALFNYTHWTLLWTIYFVYSIQVSTFTVLFGQFFKYPLLSKLIAFILWILTFIDFYPGSPVGLRYFMCLFPNTGLMFCLQVVMQYERRGSGLTSYEHLYSNVFAYPLHIGICLLMMLIYSCLYMVLAVYVERINPGEFGISQPWYFPFTPSYWRPRKTSIIAPIPEPEKEKPSTNRWIDTTASTNLSSSDNLQPSLTISHLTKKFGKFTAVSDLTLNFYKGEVCSLLGHNGAGKTTTTFILVGMLESTSGVVTVQGWDTRTNIEEVRQVLGFCPQYDILYNELSVEEHLLLIGRMRQLEAEEMTAVIDNVLEVIGLTKDRSTLSKDLSGGMKRRLSIGISLIGDPKVLILDEPTSGIDPYNRRLIWAIIRRMRDAGKCIILTTHFLEEADVLSDRIAIMTNGRLQAYGTPDFLKNQIEFEYRLFIDKKETAQDNQIVSIVRKHLPDTLIERQTATEMVIGIRRNQSKNIAPMIQALDDECSAVGIDSYGLSMTSIEEVFLKLVREEEEREVDYDAQIAQRQELAKKVFGTEHERQTGCQGFWSQIGALLIKRFHVSRRQWVFLLGFFFLPILIEIIIVSALPTPQEIQASIASTGRVKDAAVTLLPSLYNPHTIVTYASNNVSGVQTRLNSYLQSTGATVDEISSNSVLSYVRERYLATPEIFINKYQMGFSIYANTTPSQTMTVNTHFSTVNYHAMATSVSVGTTSLFQFYANSASKRIITTNQPVITPTTGFSVLFQFFEVIYCFDTIPFSLFNFLNGVLAGTFLAVLILPILQERVNQSKDLQLLTGLSKFVYWFANAIFDFCCCFIVVTLLTIVVKIGAAATTKTQAEVYVYRDTAAGGYFFFMNLLFCIASIPMIYVFSFGPKSELIGFIIFFAINLVTCFADVIFDFIALFSQASSSGTGQTGLARTIDTISRIFAFIFPGVNLKQALFSIRLKMTTECISSFNSLMYTSYSENEPWLSTREPGLGINFLFFIIQAIVCWLLLLIVENRTAISRFFRGCCGLDKELTTGPEREASATSLSRIQVNSPGLDNSINMHPLPMVGEWNDSHLDEDVRNERRAILQEDPKTTTSFMLVRDLVQRFKKRQDKSISNRVYTAVDHVNFRITRKTCFGLLGANGAGKTTTFRMLINDLKPTSGEIIIHNKDIYKTKRDIEIGFCPQFDWLLPDMSVSEIITLFARLKNLPWSIIPDLTRDMMNLFGLDDYADRCVEKLSGGNKRKVSAVIAFLANPALVFLDEPTTGLDAAAKRKLWNVIRAARDIGMTIVMTSHSMEECEALCNRIGIMKLGQFVCLGNLQRLKNRFGNGYAVQIKLVSKDTNQFKADMVANLPGVQILEEHNGMIYCNVPYSTADASGRLKSGRSMNLARIFGWFSGKNDEGLFESYSITQTTLEQIFVRVASDEDNREERQVTAL